MKTVFKVVFYLPTRFSEPVYECFISQQFHPNFFYQHFLFNPKNPYLLSLEKNALVAELVDALA